MNYFDKCPRENRVAVTNLHFDVIYAILSVFALVIANVCHSVSCVLGCEILRLGCQNDNASNHRRQRL